MDRQTRTKEDNDGGSYTQVIELPSSDNDGGGGGSSSTLNGSTTATALTTTATTLRLHLTMSDESTSGGAERTRLGRRVSWTTDTVDNEMLNRKKSKCCCVYKKPRGWDESSSEDENCDTNCQHCSGHRKTDYNSALATTSTASSSQTVVVAPSPPPLTIAINDESSAPPRSTTNESGGGGDNQQRQSTLS